jgi:hypothetical protein
MKRATRWLVVCLALGLLTAAAAAQDKPNPTGTWKWTTEFGGQTRDSTLKLKLEGDKLTGALVGRDGKDSPIEDASYKNGELAFKVTRERGGQKFSSKYSGKVEGDTIKGKIETEFGGQTRDRAWEAKRVKE